MQKLIEKLQYVADGLVKQGFGKDGESVVTIAQVIEELKQPSCQANVMRSAEFQQVIGVNDADVALMAFAFLKVAGYIPQDKFDKAIGLALTLR